MEESKEKLLAYFEMCKVLNQAMADRAPEEEEMPDDLIDDGIEFLNAGLEFKKQIENMLEKLNARN
jgi:hypothetical protein